MSAMSGVGCMFLVAGKKEMPEGSFEICKKTKKQQHLSAFIGVCEVYN